MNRNAQDGQKHKKTTEEKNINNMDMHVDEYLISCRNYVRCGIFRVREYLYVEYWWYIVKYFYVFYGIHLNSKKGESTAQLKLYCLSYYYVCGNVILDIEKLIQCLYAFVSYLGKGFVFSFIFS